MRNNMKQNIKHTHKKKREKKNRFDNVEMFDGGVTMKFAQGNKGVGDLHRNVETKSSE